jgi:hypothetical protein
MDEGACALHAAVVSTCFVPALLVLLGDVDLVLLVQDLDAHGLARRVKHAQLGLGLDRTMTSQPNKQTNKQTNKHTHTHTHTHTSRDARNGASDCARETFAVAQKRTLPGQ